MRSKSFRYPVTSLAGSTPGNIVNLLKKHKAEPKYYLKTSLSFLVASIFSIFNLVERILWKRRISNFQFDEPPVFIIGFMRSGTTLLHNLLCQDPKTGYTTTFQTVFPHCLLTQKWWLKRFTNLFLPADRPFDNVPMDMDLPQEEEFAMANIQPYSIYNFLLFPSEFNRFIEHDYDTSSLPAKDLERWKKEYRQLLIKSLLSTKGVRYISKNPHNIPRIEILKELFPDSHFIFIYRDPYVVVESLYHFILAIFPGVQLQHVPADFSRQNVAMFYSIAMKHYFMMKNNPGAPFILEIKMEDFLKNKIEGLRNIYTALGIEGFEKTLPRFENYLAKNPCARHESYEIHEETIQYVNQFASEIVVQLGYPVRN
jgi:hypothetical protein